MVSYVWTSCTKYARTRSTSTSATIMKSSALTTSRQSSASLSLSDCLSQLTSAMTWLRSFRILQELMIGKRECFVGVITERNCKQCDRSAILTKKNTPICRRGVLGAVCYDEWSVISLIVASRTYLINIFAGCYV